MKTKSPTTVACDYLFSSYVNFRLTPTSCYREPKVDKRTKYGKAVLSEYHRLRDESVVRAALNKQAQRREAKKRNHSNVLDLPIVKDWIQNKSRLKVMSDRLTDGYRNHWAKSELDRKVLAILAKHQ